jgi:ABC-type glycerol-3-phosphate transport system substrate-binding protein
VLDLTLPKCKRRVTLRWAATALAAAAGTITASGCNRAGRGAGAATLSDVLPVPQAGVTRLSFQANTQGLVSWNADTQRVFQEFVDQNFNLNPHYRGLWATAYPWGNASQQITADIGGSGYVDVWHFCCGDVPAAIRSGFAHPLNDLLKRDNISLDNWSKGHIEGDSLAGTLYGLPSYDGTMTIVYRQDLLDELGVPYPDPDWTGEEARRIWERCTGTNKQGQHRYGVNLYYNQAQLNWWLYGWGAREMNAAQDRATMASPEGVACFRYLQNLFTSGIAPPRDTRGLENLTNETAVFQMAHSAYIINAAVQLGNKYKWDFLPNPIWSANRACLETIDCYMLNTATKNIEAAWELMKWLNLGTPQGDGTYDYAWPKFQIRINLITPSLIHLWDYWETTVRQVAPTLQGRALHWWADAAIQGYARPQLFYAYDYGTAMNIEWDWMSQIASGQISPEEALRQMQGQVNALEEEAKAIAQQAPAIAQRFPTAGKDMAAVPLGV